MVRCDGLCCGCFGQSEIGFVQVSLKWLGLRLYAAGCCKECVICGFNYSSVFEVVGAC